MEYIFAVLTDVAVIFFDLLIYSMIFKLKKDTLLYRVLLYSGCGVILLSYFAGVYLWEIPASIAAAAFMTVPSFLLFLALSRHKESRFLLTFCFVDTVTLIIAFIGRYVGILFQGGSFWAFAVVVALFSVLLAAGHKRLRAYHILLDTVDSDWGLMAFCTVLIYFAMIFFTAHPKPMIQRPEYAPNWLTFVAVVLSCYVVFLQSIGKTQRIEEQNRRLEREKHLFQLVYLGMPISIAAGFAFTRQDESIEDAFIRADMKMYQNKVAINAKIHLLPNDSGRWADEAAGTVKIDNFANSGGFYVSAKRSD